MLQHQREHGKHIASWSMLPQVCYTGVPLRQQVRGRDGAGMVKCRKSGKRKTGMGHEEWNERRLLTWGHPKENNMGYSWENL